MNWLREPDSEPLPGYRLLEPIGTGGFGEVWKCVAPGGIYKAIKFVYGNLNALDGDDARALQEMKALERVKQVRHPFVLSIEQIQNVGGELVIVMELADKNLHETLQEYQAAGRPGIPRELLLGFLDDAAVGLDHLIEKHNLQHLDVKPRNLFVVADRVKVADFGLVKQLERSSSSGLMGGVTPIYAAPETFQNKISKHSDQYSLAIVYVELLSGKRPFAGKNIRQLALQHMTEPPDLSMLPAEDRPIVARALAKNPEERWPSCTAFIRALGSPRDSSGSSASGSGNSLGSGSGVREPAAWAAARRTIHDVDWTPASDGSHGRTALLSPTASMVVPKPVPEIDEEHLLGETAPQREPGILRPTILLGIGSFGRRALQEIRCRLTDRVGDVTQVPCFRFLYVDCDPDAVTKAINAPSDAALSADEVFPVPLQPVTQYRRRQLEQILDWLPREKLYSIPRSLHAGGCRALGRLAFCDNYLRFITRLRRELQIATHPESLSQSSDQTGLLVRDHTPQVYIFTSASGGSGGMLIDLGYAVRRVLTRLSPTTSPITAFVYAAAPNDPNSPEAELANVYATITELNHYADPDVTFVGQYGSLEGPKVEGHGLPFNSIYLLPMPERKSGHFRDCISHLAGYVAHELTTPLGPALERLRQRPAGFDRSPFRSFGTYGVWFPRGLLLRCAAQKITLELLKIWKSDREPDDAAAIHQVVAHVLNDARLKPEAIRERIEKEATRGSEGGPTEQMERWLTHLESQVAAVGRHPDAAVWSRTVWDQARDLIGTRPANEHDSSVRRSRLSRLLDDAIKRLAEMWGNELAEIVGPLEELPGRRLGAIETALKQLATHCGRWADAAEARIAPLTMKARQAKSDVQAAHDLCQAGSGSFSFFGGRSGRSMRHFFEQIRTFAHVRLQEDLADATAKFYRALRGRIDELLRELAFCRTRLETIVQSLESPLAHLPPSADTPVSVAEEALQHTLHPTNTLNIVLPAGDTHIERAANKIVKSLKPSDIQRLEVALQKLVLEPHGGLKSLCQLNADINRTLVSPLIEQTTAFLSEWLPVTDVTEVEVATAQARQVEVTERIKNYYARARPSCGSESDTETLVLLPDTDSGRKFGECVKAVVPAALLIPVPSLATDLMFCREHTNLRPDEVAELLAACQPAYYQALASPHTSPHARFDVTEWLPLVE